MSVTIYSTEYCPFCVAAKNLLDSLQIDYDEIDLTNNLEERVKIATKYNWRTVPIIIINEKLVGGFDELNKLYHEDKLSVLVDFKKLGYISEQIILLPDISLIIIDDLLLSIIVAEFLGSKKYFR